MLLIFAVKFEKWIFGIFSLHDGRSFAMTPDVPRYSAQVYNAVLRRNRISFTIGQIILFLMLQFEAVRSVTGFGEAPCDVFIIVF